jgi:UDP-N-acetylglucosamine 3-dehydrogenase
MSDRELHVIRTAVVGVGLMGQLFARLLVQSPRGRLVALAESDRGRAAALHAEFGVPVYDDCATLLDAEALDAAVVATPDQAHLEPALAVLARGLGLFIEKPLALTVADAEQIVAAARAANRPLMVGQVLRFDPRFVLLHDAARRGDLGTVQLIHGRRDAPLAEGRRLAGRTSLAFYLGVHDIDAIHWITGARVTQVSASYHRTVPGIGDIGGILVATLWLDSGAVATLQHAWTLPNSTYQLGYHLFEIVGSDGTGRLDALDDGLRLQSGSGVYHPSVQYLFTPLLHGRISGAYRDELEHFLECLQCGLPPLVTGDDGSAAVAVAMAIDQSAQSGLPCPVRYPAAR